MHIWVAPAVAGSNSSRGSREAAVGALQDVAAVCKTGLRWDQYMEQQLLTLHPPPPPPPTHTHTRHTHANMSHLAGALDVAWQRLLRLMLWPLELRLFSCTCCKAGVLLWVEVPLTREGWPSRGCRARGVGAFTHGRNPTATATSGAAATSGNLTTTSPVGTSCQGGLARLRLRWLLRCLLRLWLAPACGVCAGIWHELRRRVVALVLLRDHGIGHDISHVTTATTAAVAAQQCTAVAAHLSDGWQLHRLGHYQLRASRSGGGLWTLRVACISRQQTCLLAGLPAVLLWGGPGSGALCPPPLH